jgi:hypothetical protein
LKSWGIGEERPSLTPRAIDFRERDKINEVAFKELIRAAVAANSAALAQRRAKKK